MTPTTQTLRVPTKPEGAGRAVAIAVVSGLVMASVMLALGPAMAAPADEPVALAAPDQLAPSAGELSTLVATSERFPQDYAAARAMAKAGEVTGRWAVAEDGWRRAMAISGGNRESRLGLALALLQLGRVAEAREQARAVASVGDDGAAWRLLAWAQRQPVGLAPGHWGLVAAASSYRRALAIDPDDRVAACGLAWTRLAQGDRLGARQAFAQLLMDDPSDACALQGGMAAAPTVAWSGSLSGIGMAYSDHPTNKGGAGFLLGGTATFDELLYVGVHTRMLGIDRDTDYTQGEFWLRVGVDHAGFGGELLMGAIDPSTTTEPVLSVGGRVWASYGATLRLEFAATEHWDGTAGLVGAALRIPVLRFLSVDVGSRLTGLSLADGSTTGPYASVHAEALLDFDPFDVSFGFRFGQETRPLRFDEPSIWNVEELVGPGLTVDLKVPLTEHLSLTGGYELNRLVPDSGDARHAHVFTLGITAEGRGVLP